MSESHSHNGSSNGKFQLVGKVAGVDACHLISDQDEILVGSAIQCDLVLADPLVPRRAFRLKRERDHVDPEDDCDTYWVLESFPRARAYVNGDFAHRARVRPGDVIALGCHTLEFSAADASGRNRRANTGVDDLCRKLVEGGEVPSGFLESCASWMNRRRMRRALGWAGGLVCAIALLWILLPRERRFEQVQLPMEIIMLTEQFSMPDPNAVRSLEQVQRKTIAQPDEQLTRSDILQEPVQPVKALETKPLETEAPAELAKPAAPQRAQPTPVATPALPSIQVPRDESARPAVSRSAARLESGAQARRLTVAEASDPVFRKELGDVDIKISGNNATAVPINQWAGPITRAVDKPQQVKLEANRAEQLAALERYKPSPLKFEKRKGSQIPIARLPEKLAALEVKAAPSEKPQPGVVIDGEVTDQEIAVSWKSGRFRVHGPGTPPHAEPATYCYVGKIEKNGRQYLYVSFVCMDPNLDALVLRQGNGTPNLCQDDGIEIYLDTDTNRRDYYQMIVNARGNWWTSVVQNHDNGSNYTFGPAWDAQQELKTTINKAAGRWTCEVLIPFDRVGGVPAKGSRWAVNFCRNYRGQQVGHDEWLQTWFLVYDTSRNYHNPELFGMFEW